MLVLVVQSADPVEVGVDRRFHRIKSVEDRLALVEILPGFGDLLEGEAHVGDGGEDVGVGVAGGGLVDARGEGGEKG